MAAQQVKIYYRYGDSDQYLFDPTPLISMNTTINMTEAGSGLSKTTSITLSSYILPSGDASNDEEKFETIRVQQEELKALFSENYKRFYMVSNDADNFTTIDVYPKISNISFAEEGTWVDRCPYTVQFEYSEPCGSGNPLIKSFTEDWNFQENSNLTHTITHSVSAVGLASGYTDGFSNAKNFCLSRQFTQDTLPSGFLFFVNPYYFSDEYESRISNSSSGVYNKTKTESYSRSNSSYSITETWTMHYFPWIHEYNKQVDYGYITSLNIAISGITINGTITGLSTTTSGKMENAIRGWEGIGSESGIKDNIGWTYDDVIGPRPNTVSKTENPRNGTISYTVAWQPVNGESGIMSADFQESIQDPKFVMANMIAPFNSSGPIVQHMGTTTEGSRALKGSIRLRNYEVLQYNDKGFNNEEEYIKNICNQTLRMVYPDISVWESLPLEQRMIDRNYDVLDKSFSVSKGAYSWGAEFGLTFRKIYTYEQVLGSGLLF
ncbi:MAG: hypothetical protein DRZ76_01400 [Candidatus Nealsonbacteria bacterium]|nr:MAG: hypothetical protein DRZ76_01400 [Candidatus Nealsonbacteria bacterium]